MSGRLASSSPTTCSPTGWSAATSPEFSAMMIVPWLLYWCLELVKNRRVSLLLISVLPLLVDAHSAIGLVSIFTLAVAVITFLTVAGWRGLRTVAPRWSVVVVGAGLLLAPTLAGRTPIRPVLRPHQQGDQQQYVSGDFVPFWSYFYNGCYRWLANTAHLDLQIDFAIWIPIVLAVLAVLAFGYGRVRHPGRAGPGPGSSTPPSSPSWPSVSPSTAPAVAGLPRGVPVRGATRGHRLPLSDAGLHRPHRRHRWWSWWPTCSSVASPTAPARSSWPRRGWPHSSSSRRSRPPGGPPTACWPTPDQFPSTSLVGPAERRWTTRAYRGHLQLQRDALRRVPTEGVLLPGPGAHRRRPPLHAHCIGHDYGAGPLSRVPCTVGVPTQSPLESLALRFAVRCGGATRLALPVTYNAFSSVYVVGAGGKLRQIPYHHVPTDPRMVIDVPARHRRRSSSTCRPCGGCCREPASPDFVQPGPSGPTRWRLTGTSTVACPR